MSILLEPFEFEFFRNALIAATIVGALCGLIGVYVVLRGMSYIGHGLAHAIFGWAVIAATIGVGILAGAGLGGFVSALMINRVARRRTIGADAAIGVVTIAILAFGLALISLRRGFTQNFESLLFGNVLAVGVAQIVAVAVVALAVAGFVLVLYRPLLFTTFDPEVAAASGVRVSRMNSFLALALAATIVVTMQILGVLLVSAALVIPPVIARMITDSFGRMLWLSTAVGSAAGLIGVYLSWHLDIASGPAIVLVEAVAFVVTYALTARRNRLAVVDAHL